MANEEKMKGHLGKCLRERVTAIMHPVKRGEKLTEYDDIVSWMDANGYSMQKAIGEYYFCTHMDEEGYNEIIWMDSACDEAYELESATFVAYRHIIKQW